MPKFCPACMGEFRDDVEKCPNDGSKLLKKAPEPFGRLVDLYVASDAVEMEHIFSLLKAEGLRAAESVAGLSQMPSSSDTRFVIAVLEEDLKQAKAFIEQARSDGVISKKGSFC